MCGILGVVAKTPVNQLLYDGLLLLQHRGQDAAGIVTSEHKAFHMHKGPGMVRDVFRTRNMRSRTSWSSPQRVRNSIPRPSLPRWRTCIGVAAEPMRWWP